MRHAGTDTGEMRPPLAIWKEDSQLLQVVLTDVADRRRPTRTESLSSQCWVNFDRFGEVCGVDVHDVPPEVSGALQNYRGADIIGRTLLDDGWLWIPLSANHTHRRRSGVADIDLALGEEGLSALTVRFRTDS